MARLLEHADKLLAEWAAYSEQVRASADAQGRRAAEAIERAVAAGVADLSPRVGEELRRTLSAQIEALRQELARAQNEARALGAQVHGAGRASGGAADARAGRPVALLMIANVALAIALVVIVLRMGGRGASPAAPVRAVAADAGAVTPIRPPPSPLAPPAADAGAAGTPTDGHPPAAPTAPSPAAAPSPCAGLLKGIKPAAAPAHVDALVVSCAALLCQTPLPYPGKLDRPTLRTVTACLAKLAPPPPLAAALTRALGHLDQLRRCALPAGGPAEGWRVDEAWLTGCLGPSATAPKP